MISRELKEELKLLSKEVLGSSSKYEKILSKGHFEPLTEEVTEYVPGDTDEDEGVVRQVKIPVNKNGMPVSVYKKITPEELKVMLLDIKGRRDAFTAQVKQLQEEAKAKKEKEEHLQKVSRELTRSSI